MTYNRNVTNEERIRIMRERHVLILDFIKVNGESSAADVADQFPDLARKMIFNDLSILTTERLLNSRIGRAITFKCQVVRKMNFYTRTEMPIRFVSAKKPKKIKAIDELSEQVRWLFGYTTTKPDEMAIRYIEESLPRGSGLSCQGGRSYGVSSYEGPFA